MNTLKKTATALVALTITLLGAALVTAPLAMSPAAAAAARLLLRS